MGWKIELVEVLLLKRQTVRLLTGALRRAADRDLREIDPSDASTRPVGDVLGYRPDTAAKIDDP